MLLKKLIKNIPKNKKKIFISGISSNSKKVRKNFIFFAIKGKQVNGEKYIKEAINKELVYDYRGLKTKAPFNTSGWNSVYVAGKIIKKIGPILAINNEEFNNQHVVEKIN